jgi:hypothetical protein
MRTAHRSNAGISFAGLGSPACNAAMLWAVHPRSVLAELSYLEPGAERPIQYAYQPPHGGPWESCGYEPRAVRIADARALVPGASLHAEGFELRDAPSEVADFLDEDEVTGVYYAEAAELARAATGAKQVHVFDHLVRTREAGRPALGFGRRGGRPAANGRIHNDYTEDSGRRRLGLVLADPRAAAAVGRYGIVNIWRSIKGPVLDTPLALCDARSVSAADLVAGEVRFPERNGEIYLLRHSRRHRWYYYPAMDRHEALLFKQYDSQLSGVARFTPHAAFDHPDAPIDAPLRESIELRCLVVYE